MLSSTSESTVVLPSRNITNNSHIIRLSTLVLLFKFPNLFEKSAIEHKNEHTLDESICMARKEGMFQDSHRTMEYIHSLATN